MSTPPDRMRPPRARVHSLCGTARGIASEKNSKTRRSKPCRYAAIFECQRTQECSQRMEAVRR